MIMPHAFRLTLGMDLKQSILAYVKQEEMKAGSLLSCVGCLSQASIRLANESESLELAGPLEILTLSGTLTPEHVHLHISVADRLGRVYGGHLQDGSIVSHTAEICLAEYTNLSFSREPDTTTGFTELVVKEVEL
ncbi:DNA-binding protein [Photobacterium sp. DA100]|uniref:PPC domain-containing DNA-binding protein n=1 Tax=Photobacterium sp. DA100 TaxID=3027472 RepID=UPI00247A06F5|nr:PPC domain-containing DNA-binding protein [Photobacterium sp. DA100]WEM43877.1 DNA-binding protein [Photobacterium sp. DA100]